MRKIGVVIGLVAVGVALYCCYATRCGQLHVNKSTAKPISKSSLPQYLFPYKGGYKYPNVPSELRISRGDKISQRLLRTATKRSDLVIWADANNIRLVQDMGFGVFLLAQNVGYGAPIWVLYVYARSHTNWHLIYLGDGGLWRTDFFDCIYYDGIKRRLCFATKSGTLLSTVSVGKEIDLINNK